MVLPPPTNGKPLICDTLTQKGYSSLGHLGQHYLHSTLLYSHSALNPKTNPKENSEKK